MSEEEVLEAKRLRSAARDVFETQREMIRADLGAASVGKRVATRFVEDGKMIAEEAAEAANSHRGIVAIGALGLTAWFLRDPIMAFIGQIFGTEAEEETGEYDEDDEKALPGSD